MEGTAAPVRVKDEEEVGAVAVAPVTREDDSTSSPSDKADPRKSSSWKKNVTFNLGHTHYQVIRDVVADLGYTVAKDSDRKSMVIWYNSMPPIEAIYSLESYQKINHFPGTGEISRKDCLARHLTRMNRVCPKDYNFAPRSWVLPAEAIQLKKHSDDARRRGNTPTYIYKPPNSAQGKGIMLVQSADDIPSTDTVLVQEYLAKPFLIDGFKFDLRIYVFVQSFDPLRVFLYKDGLVRLSTQQYKPPTAANLDSLFMHLTNYSINKGSDDFQDSDAADEGSKRSVKWLMEWLSGHGHDTDKLWRQMSDVIIKTLLVALPHNQHLYRASQSGSSSGLKGGQEKASCCFTILGFDIFLNHKLKPYIIEVNRSPSFTCDSPLDREIKYGVVRSCLKLLRLRPSERAKSESLAKAQCQARLLKPRKKSADYTAPSRGAVTTVAESRAAARKIAVDEDADIADAERAKVAEDNAREFEEARTDFELKNQGDYMRIFPPPPGPTAEALVERYDRLISESSRLFESEHMGARRQTSDAGVDTGSRASASKTTKKKSEKAKPPSVRRSDAQSGRRSTPSVPNFEDQLFEELTKLRIRYPGKSEMWTGQMLERIRKEYGLHSYHVRQYWLFELDALQREKVLQIVKSNIERILLRISPHKHVNKLRVFQILVRVLENLTSRGGEGLWKFFDPAVSRQQAFRLVVHNNHLGPAEHKCCRRMIELCEDCVLVVYACSRNIGQSETGQPLPTFFVGTSHTTPQSHGIPSAQPTEIAQVFPGSPGRPPGRQAARPTTHITQRPVGQLTQRTSLQPKNFTLGQFEVKSALASARREDSRVHHV